MSSEALEAADTAGPSAQTGRSMRRLILAGLFAVVLLVVGLGGWSVVASISGAVIAPGSIVVETNSKRVQHDEGGIVGAIHVTNGDRVAAGDLLLTLDDTLTRANLAIVVAQLDDLEMRRARLMAERDGLSAIAGLPALETRMAGDPERAELLASQVAVFAARLATREGQTAQLEERVGQIGEEIKGLIAQRDAKSEEIEWIDQELEGVEQLFEKDLVPINRVVSLRRQRTRIRGEHGQLAAEIARARARITETRLQLLQLDRDFQTDVATERNEVQAKLAELREQQAAAEDRLRRVEIRAPVTGFVHQLAVHTVGGVLSAGETAMLVVPNADRLIVEAQVSPLEIDRVSQGQSAVVRFPAFDESVTPELNGSVAQVSADAVTDADTGQTWFRVRMHLEEAELQRLGDQILVPGMPAEVFIQTERRQALSYLLKPLTDQFERALRAE